MAVSPGGALGLTVYQAARQLGVPFSQEFEPTDRWVHAAGLNFHMLEWGDPSNIPVLMLHGALQQGHSWDFVSLALADRYRMLALDQRGHGDSDWAPDGDYSVEAQQGDLDEVVRALGLEGFVLMGHSMGGRNAYVWASRHPGILKGLVIVDTGPEMQRRGQDRIRQFRELPDELDSYNEFADRVQEYTGRTREQVLGALKYSIRERSDGKWTWKYDKGLRSLGRDDSSWTPDKLWECVKAIDCPTLLVRGANSDLFAEETMGRMREVIPDCSSVTIARAGHLVQGDNPVDFVAAVRQLLDQLS